MLPDLGLSRFIKNYFLYISNGVQVDDAVAMINVAMANKPVSPTKNLPHTQTTFFDRKMNQHKRCVLLTANERFSMNRTSQINV